MIVSIESVIVAVKRHVCLSLGIALKRKLKSEENVDVSNRSASSRTFRRFGRMSSG